MGNTWDFLRKTERSEEQGDLYIQLVGFMENDGENMMKLAADHLISV